MISVAKRNQQHPVKVADFLSNSFTLSKNGGTVYDDDGKFSSDDDVAVSSAPRMKKLSHPLLFNGASAVGRSTADGWKNEPSNKHPVLVRKNSAPISHVIRKNIQQLPPPLLPVKPKGLTPAVDPLVPKISDKDFVNNLVRSESAPSSSISSSFQLAREAVELGTFGKNHQPKTSPEKAPLFKPLSVVKKSAISADTGDNSVSNVPEIADKVSNDVLKPSGQFSCVDVVAKQPTTCASSMHRSRSYVGERLRETQRVNVTSEEDLLQDFVWFHPLATRREAEEKLHEFNQEGSFLLRYKSEAVPDVPYSLSVFKDKVYHLQIRQKQNGSYALGGLKDNELEFPCLQALVRYYKRKPLQLVKRCSDQSLPTCSTTLTNSPLK